MGKLSPLGKLVQVLHSGLVFDKVIRYLNINVYFRNREIKQKKKSVFLLT